MALINNDCCLYEIDRASHRLRFIATDDCCIRIEADYGVGYSVISVLGVEESLRVASKLMSFAMHRETFAKFLAREAANGAE